MKEESKESTAKMALRYLGVLLLVTLIGLALLYGAYQWSVFLNAEESKSPVSLIYESPTYTGGLDEYYSPVRLRYEGSPALCPVEPSHRRYITSPEGTRFIRRRLGDHGGIDISGKYHQEILSTGDGKVVEVIYKHRVYGNCVTIRHGSTGYATFYAHLSSVYVSKGQDVVSGEVIGRMGNTGMSDGEHLHYEIHLWGQQEDPLDYMDIQVDDEGKF